LVDLSRSRRKLRAMSSRDLEDLDPVQREICAFLESWGDQFVSGSEISKRLGGKRRYLRDPKWAVQPLSRLIESGHVESDSRDHYRLKRLPQEQEPAPEQPAVAKPRSSDGKKILFVDDDEGWRTVVSLFLSEPGVSVSTAKDATEALVEAESQKLDLIVLDLDLNGENGVELLKFLKRNLPDVPVILYTGRTHDEDAILAMLRAGALQYLPKGPLKELRRVVETVLRLSQASGA